MTGQPNIVAQPVPAPVPVKAPSNSPSSKAPQSFEISAPQGRPIQIDATAFSKPKAPVPKPLVLSGAEQAKGKDMMVYDVTISLVDKQTEDHKQTEEHGSRGQKKHHRRHRHHGHGKGLKSHDAHHLH
jgi:hypothetical protein